MSKFENMHKRKTSEPKKCIMFLFGKQEHFLRMMSYGKQYIPFADNLQQAERIKFVSKLYV